MAWDAAHSITLFNALYISGLITLTVTVLTAWLSPCIRRSSTWFMMIWSWLLVSVSYILIVGRQTGPEPSHAICLFQTMLIYGIRVLCSAYGGTFALQVYWSVQGTTDGKKRLTRDQLIAVHAFPILVFLAMLVLVLALGLLQPSSISRNELGMFCHSTSPYPVRITAAVVIFAMGMNVFFTARIFRLIQRRKGVSSIERKGYFSPDVAMRMIAFTCFPIVGFANFTVVANSLSLTSTSFLEWLSSQPTVYTACEILLATLPLVIALIFGSQRDILHVWGSFLPYGGSDPGNTAIRPAAA